MSKRNKSKGWGRHSLSRILIGTFFSGAILVYLINNVITWINRPKVDFYALEYNIKEDFLPKDLISQLPPFLTTELNKIEGFKIYIKNSGNSPAKNLSFTILFENCEIKNRPRIWATNASCIVQIMPSTNLKKIFPQAVYIDADSLKIKNKIYDVNIPELRTKFEVEIGFSLYGENPNIRISDILCDNCKPRKFKKSVEK